MLFIILFILILVIYEYNHILHQTILSLLGFKINMESFNNLPSQIIFIGAHTSVYDFFIGSLLYYGYFHKKYNNYILMKEDFERYTSSIFYHFDSILISNSLNKLESDSLFAQNIEIDSIYKNVQDKKLKKELEKMKLMME